MRGDGRPVNWSACPGVPPSVPPASGRPLHDTASPEISPVPPGEPVLSVADARRSYGDRAALDGAELTLHAGEFLGLLGPNGAGKTTLVRSVAGRLALDAGTVTLLGRTRRGVHERPAEWARLGVVPQELAVYPLLTARENLSCFGAVRGLSGRDLAARVDAALDWTGLADRADDPAGTFSGGMKRRLNIACGVLHDPEVVLLDEPTVGVDPQSRERIWAMLAELRDRGRALLLTTHQLDEAERVCDRIVVIDRGRTIARGTLAELVDQTVGPGRTLFLAFDGNERPPASLRLDPAAGGGFTRRIDRPAEELPGILAAAREAGLGVADLHVSRPTLQDVFLHLTGRDLRE